MTFSTHRLADAAYFQRWHEVAQSLNEGISPNGTDAHGIPALAWAVQHAQVAMVEALLLHGADPLWAEQGKTLGDFSAIGGDVAIAERLKGLGVRFEPADGAEGPVHRAADHGHAAWLSWAAEQGLDMNRTDAQGQTPLHRAVRAGHTLAVRTLIDRQVMLDWRDHSGRSPVDLCRDLQNTALAELLIGTRWLRERRSLNQIGMVLAENSPATDEVTPTSRPAPRR